MGKKKLLNILYVVLGIIIWAISHILVHYFMPHLSHIGIFLCTLVICLVIALACLISSDDCDDDCY